MDGAHAVRPSGEDIAPTDAASLRQSVLSCGSAPKIPRAQTAGGVTDASDARPRNAIHLENPTFRIRVYLQPHAISTFVSG